MAWNRAQASSKSVLDAPADGDEVAMDEAERDGLLREVVDGPLARAER